MIQPLTSADIDGLSRTEGSHVRALLSVYDKTGIVDFARGLTEQGWEIISTGGTLSALVSAGIPARSVSEITAFPEILDGRVKTLHPHIHSGLLARRDLPDHVDTLNEHDIAPIDLLAVNLYPFEATIQRPGVIDEDAIEQIDIGGPAMIRAAAKNHRDVLVVCDPTDYSAILDGVQMNQFTYHDRRSLAAKAFAHVAAYDTLVADYLSRTDDSANTWPHEVSITGRKVQTLRYGENPQQSAAAYRRLQAGPVPIGVLDARQLSGKELSFNNLLDADAAWSAILGFDQAMVSIIKHTIPCGLARGQDLASAFDLALTGDPVSAFGGIVALNQPVDMVTAERIVQTFFEVIVAPGFTEDALATLTRKKNLRLLEMPRDSISASVGTAPFDIRPIRGGLLIQNPDDEPADESNWHAVTQRDATEAELTDLRFAWHAVRHVKSNAIVLVKDGAVVGVGSGQPNRVESVRIAVKKAGARSVGAVLASDAYFPFADGLETALEAGVTAAVEPGGSVRDNEVIAAANLAGAALLFTGVRHFRH